MKTLLSVLAASTVMIGAAQAQEITQFNIGILGGENAQDRLASNECYRAAIETALGVPVKVFTPADYDGVIQGLLGGTLDLPDSFFQSDCKGRKGYAEWGFMSTTADRNIAVHYTGVAEGKAVPTLLKIQPAAVDHGGDIGKQLPLAHHYPKI